MNHSWGDFRDLPKILYTDLDLILKIQLRLQLIGGKWGHVLNG
ncbi:hypothetical protein XBJ2_2100011 [Xenorhabdus bovienii str. Jollieti]|uniref:Uncharacterized protein n=1 Tax=Xenorhabdus bovienii (strain SS-2004) TaxID=406818 RepID=D3V6H1_XENBS|nr:hypothetical protein XBJ1_4138 [Xenorhabdus bovienii SS-2004]CDH29004.1 hypothetical protein XBJ2_2100011 [Xenorhabdus bovienii str. Jollieti]